MPSRLARVYRLDSPSSLECPPPSSPAHPRVTHACACCQTLLPLLDDLFDLASLVQRCCSYSSYLQQPLAPTKLALAHCTLHIQHCAFNTAHSTLLIGHNPTCRVRSCHCTTLLTIPHQPTICTMSEINHNLDSLIRPQHHAAKSRGWDIMQRPARYYPPSLARRCSHQAS
jgi:hypothetical protein